MECENNSLPDRRWYSWGALDDEDAACDVDGRDDEWDPCYRGGYAALSSPSPEFLKSSEARHNGHHVKG